jgi:hypothetical protein
MPLQFPLAANAREALDAQRGARTIAEARELAKAAVTLVTDWLRPQPAEREGIQGKADAGVSRGFVQLYEDAKGNPVIAVTYWKPDGAVKGKAARKAQPKPEAAEPAEDHTDDLYFNKRGITSKRRKRAPDPNQLDLFGPDRQGAEHADPHNPLVVIVDEEGDGATFGGIEEQG